ncbi:O-antigen/teichoic acid export membrane protein [Streptacidiphilus sp. MAP12-16]|uniref:lipopolysaccharide biosynthesis protein n=1 Tax=Streptacidiphilus sp. MAP12-16 TaxID=3156300 RepID=UPI003513BBA0
MSNPLAKLLKVIPPGTHLVIGGTMILGAASYIQISIAGHALTGDPQKAVSELWSLVMTLSLGLFFPVEQELTRVVAARVVRGEGVAPVLRRAAVLTAGLLALIGAVLALTAGPLANTFFGHDRSLVWVFAAALVGMALVYLTRGILAGLGHFNAYGVSLGLDGLLRIVLAGALFLAGSHSAVEYGLVLAAAPLAAMLLTLPTTLRGCHHGPPMPWRELFQNMTMMIFGSVLAQVIVNAAVITTALVTTDKSLTFALLSAGVLCRIPLFVFGSLQPTLMTGLSTTATSGDRVGFRRMLLQTCAVIGGLGLLGAVPAVFAGSWLISVFLGAKNVLGPMDFFWFSAGTMCYMLAMVLGQALMALNRHRWMMLSWLAGTAALVAVTLAPGPVATRVEVAYALGSLVTALCMLLILVRGVAQPAPGPTTDGNTAASALENA